ncbi:transglycosylase family protein [Streptomyces crystallinus]|uniref:Resuscitation-promoting factor protein RpfC n=1 Tax=Streptomyces crystallinus TaxID=68191 RepID=A0ABP3QP55_9ACTN
MRSGNGRHRRPRQAPALVVAAGVTGSALALPLFAASGANAASATTWDRVAECESGGAWSADFGNGLYGGLQLSQETWQTYGGTSYAERPDLASRAQQIAVAEKVLAAKGPKAFTSCSSVSGLTSGAGAPAVDPGATPSPYVPSEEGAATPDATATPSAPAKKPPASRTPSGSASTAPKPSTTPSAPSTGASGKPGSTDAGAGGTAKTTDPAAGSASGGKHRGTPDPAESGTPATTEPGNTDNTHESGRHASRGDADSRGAGDVLGADYTVRPGDNLWDISRAHKVEGGWSALYKANEKTIGSDPNLILPGQNLDLNLAKTDNPAPTKG